MEDILNKEKLKIPQMKWITADFATSLTDESLFDRIIDGVSELDIGLVINNVGVYEVYGIYPNFFHRYLGWIS